MNLVTKKLPHAAILTAITLFLAGCAATPAPLPAKATAEVATLTAAEISRVQSERAMIHTLQHNCLVGEISDAQRKYVTTLDEYHAQRYLFAMAMDADASRCAEQTIRGCESLYPGQCIAEPGEVEGRQP